MPNYKWVGVDLYGKTRKGVLFATSSEKLADELLANDIAVIKSKQQRAFVSPIFCPITLQMKMHVFSQLATLIGAGVRLPQALDLVSKQVTHVTLKDALHAVARAVKKGTALQAALARYPFIFDAIMLQTVQAGQEAGKLERALRALGAHVQRRAVFAKKIKSAAILPLVTFGVFLLIAAVIFIFVVPSFATMFISMHKEVPHLTQQMINVSTFVRSWAMLWVLGGCVLLLALLRQMAKTKKGKPVIDACTVRAPFVSAVVRNGAYASFFQSVALLTEGGVHLLPALRISQEAVRNMVLARELAQLATQVEVGQSLSQALLTHPQMSFDHEMVAMVRVGEESSCLPPMLFRVAVHYQEKVDRALMLFTTVFQPALMIILGLLVTLLIFAVYLPVFNLSNVVF